MRLSSDPPWAAPGPRGPVIEVLRDFGVGGVRGSSGSVVESIRRSVGMAREREEREDETRANAADAGDVAIDAELVRRTQAGDMDAYGELVRRHMRRAFAIAYSVLRHREDAEDVVQDAFRKALEAIGRVDDARPFPPWFHRIVVNRAISVSRARSVRDHSPLHEGFPSNDATVERDFEVSELRGRLLRALDALPERERHIVVLADVEELTSKEISEITGMPSGTVRYLLHMARRTLREALSTETEEER